jgi:hypothetical protein
VGAQKNNGGFGGAEEALFERRDFRDRFDGLERREHQGEGLFFAVL